MLAVIGVNGLIGFMSETWAEQTIASLGIDNVSFVVGDGSQGLPDEAPFDAINVAAATGEHRASEDTTEWMAVYEDFIRTKKQCGEPTDGLTFDKFQQMAFSLLTSNRMRQALDIGRESLPIRESYGMTLFGQAALTARRLVEAGSRFVTVFWDGFGQFSGCAWDFFCS